MAIWITESEWPNYISLWNTVCYQGTTACISGETELITQNKQNFTKSQHKNCDCYSVICMPLINNHHNPLGRKQQEQKLKMYYSQKGLWR